MSAFRAVLLIGSTEPAWMPTCISMRASSSMSLWAATDTIHLLVEFSRSHVRLRGNRGNLIQAFDQFVGTRWSLARRAVEQIADEIRHRCGQSGVVHEAVGDASLDTAGSPRLVQKRLNSCERFEQDHRQGPQVVGAAGE